MWFLLVTALAGAAAKLPADAPVYIVIQPAMLAEDASFLNLAARTLPGIAKAEDALRDLLHFDPLRKTDWLRIGLDPEAPLACSLLSVDRGEIDRVLAALEKGQTAPRAAMRHRVVAKVSDPIKLRTFLRDLGRTP